MASWIDAKRAELELAGVTGRLQAEDFCGEADVMSLGIGEVDDTQKKGAICSFCCVVGKISVLCFVNFVFVCDLHTIINQNNLLVLGELIGVVKL